MIIRIKKIIRRLLGMIGIRIHPVQTKELAFLHLYNIVTVFDIGANVGQFAQEIRAELPEAMIYSFEPVKTTYENLIKNFSADKPK